MITETAYYQRELTTGKCRCCGDESEEILIGDGRCVDCIQEEEFYEETMKGL